VAYALLIGTKIINLGWPWTAANWNFLWILRYFAFLPGNKSNNS